MEILNAHRIQPTHHPISLLRNIKTGVARAVRFAKTNQVWNPHGVMAHQTRGQCQPVFLVGAKAVHQHHVGPLSAFEIRGAPVYGIEAAFDQAHLFAF
jgi:hypothetical protein